MRGSETKYQFPGLAQVDNERVKEPFSARSQSPDDRRTFESVLDSARKKVSERSYNAAVEDCKLAMTILMARPPSMAIQHSISECLETMADAYFAQQQHETALTKYEEAFQVRGQVFQRVEKPMMELLFKLERCLSHLVASGYVEKFNETENRWKAFVLSPAPGSLEPLRNESIIPGQDVAELQQLWKRVSRKQKSEARVTNIINRLSMPALLIPGIIVLVLLIAVPLCLSYIKSANDAVANKQNTVSSTSKTGSDTGSETATTTAGTTNSSSPPSAETKSGSGTVASTAAATATTTSSSSSTAASAPGSVKSDLVDWLDEMKTGTYSAQEFASADKEVVLKFQSDKTVHLKNGNFPPVECAYFADGGSVSNLAALFEKMIFHKCYWLSIANFGLLDAGGTNLFDTTAPEFTTIQQMAHIAIAGKDFAGMKHVGGDNVTFKSAPGKSGEVIVNGLKPELATKKPNSIVCVLMPDTKKKTVFLVGLDRNKNLLPAGRNGRNIVTIGDVDFSKQVLPEFDTVIVTDNQLQQARYKAVYILSIIAAALLVLCIFSKSRPVKSVGVLFMIIVVILAGIALANTLQSLGIQKVK